MVWLKVAVTFNHFSFGGSLMYKIKAKVMGLEEKREVLGSYPTGERDVNGKMLYAPKYRDMGWYISLSGSHESLFLGTEKPNLRVGQDVWIKIEAA